MKILLFISSILMLCWSPAFGQDSFGTKWNQIEGTLIPATDIGKIDLSGVKTIFGNTSGLEVGGVSEGDSPTFDTGTFNNISVDNSITLKDFDASHAGKFVMHHDDNGSRGETFLDFQGSGNLKFTIQDDGVTVWQLTNSNITAGSTIYPMIKRATATSTLPTVLAQQGNEQTGMGGELHTVSLIARLIEAARFQNHTTTFYPAGTGQVTIADDGSLSVDGSLTLSIQTDTTGPVTVGGSSIYICDSTAGSFTYNLPVCSGVSYGPYTFKQKKGVGNICYVNADGAEEIEGFGNYSGLDSTLGEAIEVACDGTTSTLHIIGSN